MKKTLDLSETAYVEMILAIEGSTSHAQVAFILVRTSKTDNYPDGSANIAWTKLVRKFEAKTKPSLLKLKKIFLASKLNRKTDDPDYWITMLDDIRVKIKDINNKGIDDDDFIGKIILSVSKEYEFIVNQIEEEKISSGGITLEDVREKLSFKYEKLNVVHDNEDGFDPKTNDNKEKALTTTS